MRVRVVGAGVIGLSTALRLLERGHEVQVVAERLPPETVSAVAGGLWYPYLAAPEEDVVRWSAAALAEFRRLAEVPGTGVGLVAGTDTRRTPAPPPTWAGLFPDFRVVATPAGQAVAWSFTTPLVDMPTYLAWLAGRIGELGGRIERRHLDAVPDDGVPTVIACGLGARELLGDTTTAPIRGQVVVLAPCGVDRWWLSDDDEGPVYVLPRQRDIVVGGSDERGRFDTEPDPDQARRILARATAAVPGLADATVLAHRVGLRPARPEVRLDADDSGSARVVHCYGHGGAGITMSWGCADDAAELVTAS